LLHWKAFKNFPLNIIISKILSKFGFPFTIYSKSTLFPFPLKGGLPVSKMNAIIPILQTSQLESYVFFPIISGAMYNGEPTISFTPVLGS
jgi:hypothetical protein